MDGRTDSVTPSLGTGEKHRVEIQRNSRRKKLLTTIGALASALLGTCIGQRIAANPSTVGASFLGANRYPLSPRIVIDLINQPNFLATLKELTSEQQGQLQTALDSLCLLKKQGTSRQEHSPLQYRTNHPEP